MRGPLAADRLARFERDGFVAVPGLLPAREAARLAVFAAELEEAEEVPGGVRKYYDEERRREGVVLLSRIEYFRNFHAGLRALMEEGLLPAALTQLLGGPPRLFKDKINLKPPGGSGFEPHQDAQAGWDAYCARHLTAVVAIDAATPESGCLELAAGAHRRGLLGAHWRPLQGPELAGLEFRPEPCEPGDALFFDSYVPHRSAPNRTDRSRRILYLTYNPASQGDHYERYFADKRASYPPDVERLPGREYRYRV
jgi:ectoine hydroxylase-related dioxygenase (phytanoyl-CoA dioxygenase family)